MKNPYQRSDGLGRCIFGYPALPVLDPRAASLPGSPLVSSTQPNINNSLLDRAPFVQREHRTQNKGCSRQHRHIQRPSTAPEIAQVALYQRGTKDGILFTNAILYTERVLHQHHVRMSRIQAVMEFQNFARNVLIDALPLGFTQLILAATPFERFVKYYPHVIEEYPDDALKASKKDLMNVLFVLKKAMRSHTDMVLSYGSFFCNNSSILLFGAWPSISDIPDNVHIWPESIRLRGHSLKKVTLYKRHLRHTTAAKQIFDCGDFIDSNPESELDNVPDTLADIHEEETVVYAGKKHQVRQSRKNRKKKQQQYRKRARHNKQAERDLWCNYWSGSEDCVTCEDEENYRTLADVYVDELLLDPCITEAAWAIHDGTMNENAAVITKAYYIYAEYLLNIGE